MPELPEVEVIMRELGPKIVGETVGDVRALWHKTVVRNDGYSPVSESIRNVSRHGKYILMQLDSGYIIVHLRMTGQLMVGNGDPASEKHLRAVIQLSNSKDIYFYDSRKFGRIYLVKLPHHVLRNTGIDALDPEFTWQILHQFTRGKKTNIKSLLLNQKYVTGLGNIYIDESLFLAGIHPLTPAGKLGVADIQKLYSAAIDILQRAIAGMGTTISDYKTVGGGFGSFQNALNVYGHQGEVCPRCDHIVEKIRIGNRGSHFCPGCQKPKIVI